MTVLFFVSLKQGERTGITVVIPRIPKCPLTSAQRKGHRCGTVPVAEPLCARPADRNDGKRERLGAKKRDRAEAIRVATLLRQRQGSRSCPWCGDEPIEGLVQESLIQCFYPTGGKQPAVLFFLFSFFFLGRSQAPGVARHSARRAFSKGGQRGNARRRLRPARSARANAGGAPVVGAIRPSLPSRLRTRRRMRHQRILRRCGRRPPLRPVERNQRVEGGGARRCSQRPPSRRCPVQTVNVACPLAAARVAGGVTDEAVSGADP